jgi:MoxR-like ATPase
MGLVQQVGERIVENVERVIIGKHLEVQLACVAMLCQGHVLIEDVPGVGKTVMAKALAPFGGCTFRASSFTPDLLPSDITVRLLCSTKRRANSSFGPPHHGPTRADR